MRVWPMLLVLSLGGCFPAVPDAADTAADSQDDTSQQGIDTTQDTALPTDTVAEDTATSPDTRDEDTILTSDTLDGDTTVVPECGSDADCAHLNVPPCVAGTCDDGTCVSVMVTGTCDDGDPCTTEDTCTETGCAGRAWTDEESAGWAVLFDGPSTDYVADVAIHPSGSVTVVGSFEDTASLAGEVRTAHGDSGAPDVFVARFDRTGALEWVEQAGGDDVDFSLRVAADGEDAIVAGWFQGIATFGSGAAEVSINAQSEAGQSFIARYGPAGAPASVRRIPGTVRALTPAPGQAGGVYLVGAFHDTVAFERATTAPVELAAAGGLDLYIAKVDAAGEPVWVSHAASTADDGFDGLVKGALAVREDGFIAMTAYFGAGDATYSFGSSLTGLSATAFSGYAPVLLFITPDGALAASRAFSDGASVSVPTALDWSSPTRVFAAGLELAGTDTPTVHYYVESLSPSDGASLWRTNLVGGIAYGEFMSPLMVTHLGKESVVIGSLASDLRLEEQVPNGTTLSADGPGARVFVARYDALGHAIRAVASPRSGALVANEFAYRTELRAEGTPELLWASIATSPESFCVSVPTSDGTPYGYLPGPPWVPAQAWTLQGDVGEVYCVGAHNALGCPAP